MQFFQHRLGCLGLLMGVVEAKVKWELAKVSSIWLHAGGGVGLVLSVELGWVEVLES